MSTCLPPQNKTFLTIGQDLFSIEDYISTLYNYTLHDGKNHSHSISEVTPAYLMAYTDIQKLEGLDTPVDYGSGVEYADALHDKTGVQIGLWLSGNKGCQDIVDGKLDAQIDYLITFISYTLQRPVFLRIGYEFDNPGFKYSDPDLYKAAFQKIAMKCRSKAACRKNMMVWHSWAAGVPNGYRLKDYYPGDALVDWIGISIFSQFDRRRSHQVGNRKTVEKVLDFANDHEKPVMIAESTPYGGINHFEDPWNDWFEPVLDLIEGHDIKMWSYINCDWKNQPMWRSAGFGDTRLSTNKTVLKLWTKNVLHNPRFEMHPCGDPWESAAPLERLGWSSPLTSFLGVTGAFLFLGLFAMCCCRPDFRLLSSHSDGPQIHTHRSYGAVG